MKITKKSICPFGLPITIACKIIGKAIDKMKVVDDGEEKDYCNMENNWYTMYYHMSDSSNHSRCPYAKAIGYCAVECSYFAENEEEETTQLSIDGSPTQIGVYDTNPINNGVPVYGDSHTYDDNVRDVPLGLANVGKGYPNLS